MRGGTAIYNTARPKRFAEVLGQGQVTELLVKQGKLKAWGHAYLLYGPSGTGKTTTARILAAAVNCQNLNGTGEPCGECQPCRLIPKGDYWDLIEVDGASQRGIEEIRDLKAKAYLAPWGKVKVYIIDECHALTEAAWHALLKFLEEPPPQTVIILCTTQADKIPLTVKSRCQLYPFKALDGATVKGKLARIAGEWGITLDTKHLAMIAETSAGNMRSAENLLEQCIVMQA